MNNRTSYRFIFVAICSLIIGHIFKSTIDIQLHDTYVVTSSQHASIFISFILIFYALGYFVLKSYPAPALLRWCHWLFTLIWLGLSVYLIYFSKMPIGDSGSINYRMHSSFALWICSIAFSVMTFLVIVIFAFILLLKNRLGY